MEYLHTQASMPTNGTGVPISIDAVDPNGNYVHIATVTSDLSGTYSYTWKPENAGDYTITATFAGDDSYGTSWAETHTSVVEATATTAPPTTTAFSMPPYEIYTVGTGIAVIIAIAVAVLILKKKP
jgi:hypothetical protein